jgi:uncharacterized protein YeaO (DUF488 family)
MTLLYAAKDQNYNNAAALKCYLGARLLSKGEHEQP